MDDYTPKQGFKINKVTEPLYIEDPVLTFEDSMLYGCTLNLNFEELKDFCQNRGWNNLMIFQNLYQLKYFGKSGNSNPAYLNDWEQISIYKDEMSQAGVFSDETGACQFPSTHSVDIFYQKIGTVSDPQYLMMQMQHGQVK